MLTFLNSIMARNWQFEKIINDCGLRRLVSCQTCGAGEQDTQGFHPWKNELLVAGSLYLPDSACQNFGIRPRGR